MQSRVGSLWQIDTLGGGIANRRDPDAVYSDFSSSPWGATSDYSDEETRPTGEILNFGVSPYNKDGLQNINLLIHTRGKNHAFTGSTGFNNAVVPDLDIQVQLSMIIDRHKKEITIVSNLLGDGFPNAEAFIVDGAGTSLMLNTHHRMGFAAGQLISNHNHLLAG